MILENYLIEDSIVDLVNFLISKAITLGASDIHLEHDNDGLRVRYRIDGVLHDQPKIGKQLMLQVAGRIKVLAKLDLSERRIPQDGKIRHACEDGFVDLRISTFPGVYGEKFVIRILDQRHHNVDLEQIGMDLSTLKKIRNLITRPHGFIVVTGPTGSGKTTTLYAMLKALHAPDKNIITLEDPVEYLITGITQGQIYPKAGFSFAKGIRALLRQDPDIAMIGEIRDSESARIAIEAALTGHVVLSTLHTNDAAGAVARLMDMGIEPFLLNASLSGVIAQRLVRRLCEHCKVAGAPSLQEQVLMAEYDIDCKQLFKAVGCEQCKQLGFKGRIGIFELLEIDEPLRELIIKHPRLHDIYQRGVASGMVPMKQDAIQKLEAGITTLGEILRVIS
jgi:type II secretory ATPase GspE/PulE/Tfp pilus assembly ATPase PilB-like protein